MNLIEHVMRVMTHIHIGAALGLAAWVPWFGRQGVSGQTTPAGREAGVEALMGLAHAGEPVPMQRVPVHAGATTLSPRHPTRPALQRAAVALSAANL